MKKMKKGFTIVELVIVIAVIAILSSVLIPVFSNILNKANLSNDKSFVRNANVTLTTEAIIDEFNYPSDAIYALNKNGFTGKYNAYSSNASYAYHKESNKMYLVIDNEVVYPEGGQASISSLWFLWQGKAVDKVAGATKYIALTNIGNAYYEAHFGDGANYTIDLGGHNINASVTLNNVTVVNGVLISGANGGANVSSLTAGSKAEDVVAGTPSNPTLVENKVFTEANAIAGARNITFKNCVFYNLKTEGIGLNGATFDGCTFYDSQEKGYIFNVQGDSSKNYEGNLTVKNCEFINCARVFNIPMVVYGEDNPGSITITGNTFRGVTENKRGVIQIMTQQVADGATSKGYITLNISGNNFTDIGSTQAGIIVLHEGLRADRAAGMLADSITFSNNVVASSIPVEKCIVNDDGAADGAWSNDYFALKTAITNKFNASKI